MQKKKHSVDHVIRTNRLNRVLHQVFYFHNTSPKITSSAKASRLFVTPACVLQTKVESITLRRRWAEPPGARP